MKKIALSVLMTATLIYADFTRNNGIVTDNATGLQWQDDYSDNGDNIKYTTWIGAINYCEALSLGGYSDWRLPNKKELLSIVDYDKYDPAIDTVFTHTASDYYWSSTTHAGYTDLAWFVFFGNGFTDYSGKSDDYYVRCVR